MVLNEAGKMTHMQVTLWVRSINTGTFEVLITVPLLNALQLHARQGPNINLWRAYDKKVLWALRYWKGISSSSIEIGQCV